MRLFFNLVFATLFPVVLMATEVTDATDSPADAAASTVDTSAEADSPVAAEEVDGLLFFDAREVDVREFIWTRRIIVVMAETPDDPQFNRQLEALRERAGEFVVRDAVIIFDAHPADRSPLRQVLRPRGFTTAIIDKDGEVKARRPAVRSGRELMAVIDRFPTRREEILERSPSGR